MDVEYEVKESSNLTKIFLFLGLRFLRNNNIKIRFQIYRNIQKYNTLNVQFEMIRKKKNKTTEFINNKYFKKCEQIQICCFVLYAKIKNDLSDF